MDKQEKIKDLLSQLDAIEHDSHQGTIMPILDTLNAKIEQVSNDAVPHETIDELKQQLSDISTSIQSEFDSRDQENAQLIQQLRKEIIELGMSSETVTDSKLFLLEGKINAIPPVDFSPIEDRLKTALADIESKIPTIPDPIDTVALKQEILSAVQPSITEVRNDFITNLNKGGGHANRNIKFSGSILTRYTDLNILGASFANNDTTKQADVTLPSGGGAGNPGGSTTQLQYNNSGAFGGMARVTTDGNDLILTGQASPTYTQGKLVYDTDNESLTFYNSDSNISLQVGQEEWIRVKNVTGSTIPNGSAVYISGASAGLPTVALALASDSARTIGAGLATEAIANNAIGYVTSIGVVHGLDTSAFTAGQTVFISSTVAGGLVSTAPTAPNYRYRVGIVAVSSATVGSIHVTPSTAALGNGTSNQVFGINNAGTAQEVKSLVGTTNRLTITHSANTVTHDISASYVGQSSITTVGTLTNLTVTNAPTFSAMTLGSVLFAGTAGVLTQNNSKFFWDNTNFRLGVGTTTPRTAIDLAISVANGGILSLQNLASNGYSAADVYNDLGTKVAGFGVGGSTTGAPFNGNFYFGTNFTADAIFVTNSTVAMTVLGADQTVKIATLAGSGNRMVIAGSTGILSTQAITTGTVTSVATDATLTGGTITSTGTLGLNLANANTWTGAQTISTVPFTISGNQSAAAWTTTGTQFKISAATLNDTTSTGTVALTAASAILAPTLTATSASTYTASTTLYISGAPVASTNVTQTNSYALYVAAGSTALLGGVATSASNTSSNFFANAGSGTVSTSTAQSQFGGSTSVNIRSLFNGTTATVMGVGFNYGNVIVASDPISTAATGTNTWLANLVVNPIGTITGSTTATNSTALYIGGAASGATTNYALYVASGNTQLNNGNLTLGTAGNKINITTGTNASVGTATLSGGTVTVSTTAVTASSKIFLTDATTGALTNIGTPTVGTIVAGTSFVINSSNVLDTSNINWFIIN